MVSIYLGCFTFLCQIVTRVETQHVTVASAFMTIELCMRNFDDIEVLCIFDEF